MSYKSHRYSYKVHFNISHYEHVLHEEDLTVRLTNQAYLEAREKMIRFILEKGRLLKMSLKTLHLSVHVMDMFCEKLKHSFLLKDELLIAACCLLVSAKSGELDERVPFISKLVKYTGLQNPCQDFKEGEVEVAQALNWDLQKITFYSFVEYYLTAGVLTPHDMLSKKLLEFVKEHGVEETVRSLAREEQKRPMFQIESLYGRICTSSIRDTMENLSKEDFVPLNSIPEPVRAEVIKVFELYSRDLSNLVLREFRYWTYTKNSVASSILIYARTALFEHSCAWNSRMRELTGLTIGEIRGVFSNLNEFISTGEQDILPQRKEERKDVTRTPAPLAEVNTNFESKSNPSARYSSYNYYSALERDMKKFAQNSRDLSKSKDKPHAKRGLSSRRAQESKEN